MAVIETGSSTAGMANVDATYNLKVNTPLVEADAGFSTMLTQNDAGTIVGTRYMREPYTSEDYRLSIGQDTISALYNFTSSTQNTGDFKHAFTTMTMTQSGGFLNINPALATVSGNYAYLQTWRYFSLQGAAGNLTSIIGQISGAIPSNQIFEAGHFLGTAGVVPADGAFFRLTSAGLYAVLSYNGSETSVLTNVASIPLNTNALYAIIINQRSVEFWVDYVLVADIPTPSSQAVPFLWLNLPVCVMMRNSGTVTGGSTIKIGSIHVEQLDMQTSKSYAHQMAIQGNSYQGQEGDTMGSLAIYSNAAIGAAAALTNTTAAAPNIGLGGAVLVLPTLAAGTDGILFSYLNPVPTVTLPGKTLVVTGVRIDSGVQTVLVGGPLNLVMGVAFGATALTLATTETGSFVTATTKAPRRIALGVINYIAAAAAGVGANEVAVTFDCPIVVNPGEYFQITCRNVGTVTTTGALIMTATVDHYFE